MIASISFHDLATITFQSLWYVRVALLLIHFLYVVVHQAGNTHLAAAFVAESSRDFKSILLFPDGPVDFDFLQGVVCFSAAFCAEVSLVFHGGTLPSGFTFFIIVSLPLFFVNNKAADSLSLSETISGFMILQCSQTQKWHLLLKAGAIFRHSRLLQNGVIVV